MVALGVVPVASLTVVSMSEVPDSPDSPSEVPDSPGSPSEVPDSPGSPSEALDSSDSLTEKVGGGQVTSDLDSGLTSNSRRGQVPGFESHPSHEKHSSPLPPLPPAHSHTLSSNDPVDQFLPFPASSANNDPDLSQGTSSQVNNTAHRPETRIACGASASAVRLARAPASWLKTCFPSKPRDSSEAGRSAAPGRKLFDWALLREPHFLLYCFSICLFTVSLKSSLIFLPALVRETGVSEVEAAYLLSISGVVDTIGRIAVGWMLSLKPVRRFRPAFFAGFIFAACAVFFLAPFMSNFTEFGVVFALFGFLTGAYISQKSLILVDTLGVDRLASSFGLLCFFQGVGNLVGPPLSGVLKDTLGHYREVFFLGGGSLAGAGVLMIISNIYAERAAY